MSKQFILERLREEDIFEKYLGEPVVLGVKFCSPLREDRNPTCNFYMREKGLYFKDWSGDFYGDCFDIVQRLYNLTFKEAMQRVAIDFNLIDGNNIAPAFRKKIYKRRVKDKSKRKIQIKSRPWNQVDKDFWSRFKIHRTVLERFSVCAISHLWIDGEIKWEYRPTDPAYAYYFGDGNYKIYFPMRKGKFRFISNGPHLQGWREVDLTSNTIIITKSLKDVMSLYTMGYTAISPPAEGALIDPQTVKFFENYDITLLFDNDQPGIKWAKANSLEYQIPYTFYDVEGVKDTSDLVELVGIEEAKLILQRHLKQRKLCQTEEESSYLVTQTEQKQH